MSYLVLARKWRPRNFSELIGQEPTVQTLTQALTTQRLHHAYLFTGTRGSGKTTLARILAKALNCEQGISATPCGICTHCEAIDQGNFPDLIEVDAASRTKVEDTREILDNVPYMPTQGRFKIYLIDEVHMLSGHSFNALLKTLEEPPSHVKFLLATTDPQKLPMTVLSRCLQFHLKNIAIEKIPPYLAHILEAEKIPYEQEALLLLAEAAEGSMRDALSLLDQAIAFSGHDIKTVHIRKMLGDLSTQDLLNLLEALVQAQPQQVIAQSRALMAEGVDFKRVLSSLLRMFHQITLLQCVPDLDPQFLPMTQVDLLTRFAKTIAAEEIQLFYQIALKGAEDLLLAPTQAIGFEMTLLRMLAFRPANESRLESRSIEGNKNESRSPSRDLPVQKNEIPENAMITPPSPPLILPDTQSHTTTWEDIPPKLGLSGVLLTLAQHCALISKKGPEVTLAIEHNYQSLLTPILKKRMEDALCQYYSEKIVLILQSSESQVTSSILKQQPTEILHNDENLQEILKTFSATITEGSIESH